MGALMWNRFLLKLRSFRGHYLGALLTLVLTSLSAVSCSSSSAPTGGVSGSGNAPGVGGASGAGGAPVTCPVCAATQVCNNGVCGCSADKVACGTTCTSVANDGSNCGACGVMCPTATPFCSAAQCISACPVGTMTCRASCVNTQTDTLNCGVCGTACGAGQTCTAGVCVGGAGGAGGGGASGVAGAGGVGAGGTSGAAGSAGMGTIGTAGSAGTTGTAGAGSGTRPPGCPAAAAVLSDFEEGSGVLVKQGGRTGWWYVYNDSPTAGTQTPAASTGAIAATLLPATDTPPPSTCNKYAMHSTAGGHPMYAGFGATLVPGATASAKTALSLSPYTGISFRIRTGSGTAPPLWFEILNKETQPADTGGTATNNAVDMYNTRGKLLTGITTSWQTMYVPFATLAPRYVPGGCAAGIFCEAPQFNPASALGFQFSLYSQFSTAGAYDLWVDDVTLTTGDTGLPTQAAGTAKFPFPVDKAMGNGCLKPTGATGKDLVQAFINWKAAFVTADGANMRVKFDDPSATVSEGIGYGMLIAVAMGDKALFDGLWGYWTAHPSNDSLLMTWKVPGGAGSAIDADEDVAFALIQADKQWPGGAYLTNAKSMLTQIRTKELDPGTNAVRPGNQFGNNASDLTNPSYFAPAYYRVFAMVDTVGAANWTGAVTSVYSYLNKIAPANGLVPAWCTNSCASRGGGGYADSDKYQYDAHRTPWRMALDVCWNNDADAKAYVTKTTNFFSSKAGATAGLGSLADLYNADGTVCAACSSAAKQNSMSLIGTMTAGAMATGSAANQAFIDRGWHFLLDGAYTADPTFRTGATTAYTYYNATVGLITALTLSGNFSNY
jgi:endoglucanase